MARQSAGRSKVHKVMKEKKRGHAEIRQREEG